MTRLTKVGIALANVMLAMIFAIPSSAGVVTNVTVPISGTGTNPCNGHPFSFTASEHVLVTTTFDAAGGFNGHLEFNNMHDEVTDLLTGIQCKAHGRESLSMHNIDVQSGTVYDLPIVVSATFRTDANCPNSQGSFVITVHAHTTINPDGKATVFFDNSPGDLKCG